MWIMERMLKCYYDAYKKKWYYEKWKLSKLNQFQPLISLKFKQKEEPRITMTCFIKSRTQLVVKDCVRTQFVTIPNWYWVRTLKAQTIKFVKRELKG